MPLGDSNKPINKSTGFTLLELMIIIAVMGILSAIAIPAFTSMLPGMRLNGAARTVMGDLMAARMKAVKLNQKTKVFFDNDHQYRICNDANNDGTVDDGEGNEESRDIQNEYHSVTLDKTGYNDPVFQPRGTASIIFITLTNSEGTQKKVKVHLTGRIKIENV